MAHIERIWVKEAGHWILVIAGIMGIAAFILSFIFGVVIGFAYLVELFR